MSLLLKEIIPEKPQYKDRRFPGTQEDWDRCLKETATVYVGNLSFCTREEQVYEVFNKTGPVERVIMGLHKEQRTPCGFCFVIYHRREHAEAAVSFINRTMLDNRLIRVDLDWGFVEGRQFGRGKSGGQVRDEYRQDYDAGRGGLGVQASQYERGMMAEEAQARGHRRNRAEFEDGAPPHRRPVPPPVPPPHPPPVPPEEDATAEPSAREDDDGDGDAPRAREAGHDEERPRKRGRHDSDAEEAAEAGDEEKDGAQEGDVEMEAVENEGAEDEGGEEMEGNGLESHAIAVDDDDAAL